MDSMTAQPVGQAAPTQEGLAAEVEAFAKETGQPAPQTQTPEAQAPAEPQAQAETPQAETPAQEPAKVEVPAKFQAPDGTPDLARVEKSTVNAEAQIAKYLAEEKKLRQLANQVNALRKEVIPQASQTIQQIQAPQAGPDLNLVTPQQIMEDLVSNGMSIDMAKQMATTQYKLAMLAKESAYRQAAAESEARYATLNDRIQAEAQQQELKAIAQSDPWVFSEDGLRTLTEIRQANPYLNYSERPWQAAYEKHLANQFRAQRAGVEVNKPTPKTQAELIAPVSVPPRPQAAPQLDFSNRESYEARLGKMGLDKQIEFLAAELNRRGLKVKK